MANLFEPGGDLWGAKGTGLKYTEAQRLRATLNAQKAEVLHGNNVDINVTSATLSTEGSIYLLPIAFVEQLKSNAIRRLDASPQRVLEPIDGPLEDKALNWDHDTSPIYWLYIPVDGDMTEAWPVYGYGADYGYGYHVTPAFGCSRP